MICLDLSYDVYNKIKSMASICSEEKKRRATHTKQNDFVFIINHMETFLERIRAFDITGQVIVLFLSQ